MIEISRITMPGVHLKRHIGLAIRIAALYALFAATALSVKAADIWISPVDPVVRAANRWDASADYMNLFLPDAPWSSVAAQTHVFKIGPGFALQGREEDLKLIFADLQRRHIALALEMGMLTISDDCHETTEAYGRPGLVEHVLYRIKRLGGNVQYIAMDEPFFYGHEYNGPDACKLSAAQLSQDVALNVAIANRIFPDAKIGDEEPVYFSTDFLNATKVWIDAYAKATGRRLYFFHADENWSLQGTRNLVPLATFLKSRLVRFGVIYNAGPEGTNNALWAQAAIWHSDQVETELGLRPDDALFQTWEKFPNRVLPETTNDTLTNIALHYLKPRTSLSLKRVGVRLTGVLTDDRGAPVAHASITLGTIGEVSDFAMVRQSASGNVPANASAALLAVRVNTELSCVNCAGVVKAEIGAAHYRESAGNTVAHDFPPSRLNVSAAQVVSTNSARFPVTPGAPFTLEVPLAVQTAAERAGSIAVLFVDVAGHEVQRRKINLEATETAVGTVETSTNGSFSFMLRPAPVNGQTPAFTARFDGTSALRGASASIR